MGASKSKDAKQKPLMPSDGEQVFLDAQDQPHRVRDKTQLSVNGGHLCKTLAKEDAPGMFSLVQEAPISESSGLDSGQDVEKQKDPNAAGDRVIYIDWMRIMAIYLVVCFHVIQGLDDYCQLFEGEGGAIKDCGYCESTQRPTQSRVLIENFQTFCLMIGMPVFFHISGRAQALTKQTKSLGEIMVTRVKRLGLPFLVAWSLLIPPWLYMSWPPAPVWAQESLWAFEKWYWQLDTFKTYGINTGWLWFLPALLFVDLLAAPLLQFAETRNLVNGIIAAASVVVTYFVVWKVCGLTNAFAGWSVFGQSCSTLLTLFIPFPDKQGQDIESDAFKMLITFLSRKLSRFKKIEESLRQARDKWYQIFRWVALRLSTGVQMFTSVMMVRNFRYAELDTFAMVPALMLFYGFYIQGYYSERWSQGAKDLFVVDPKVDIYGHGRAKTDQDSYSDSDKYVVKVFKKVVRLYQIVAAMFLMMSLCSSAPAGHRERMLYPAYSASFQYIEGEGENIGFGVCHVLGTWAWLTVCLGLGQAYLNNAIFPEVYKHASASTTIVYIFHWMFLKAGCVFIINKFKMKGDCEHADGECKGALIWKMIDPALLFCVSVSGSLMIYYALLRCPRWLPLGKLFGL